ncbi:isopropylmalate synthase [Oscillospiraceae bacterium WX1]
MKRLTDMTMCCLGAAAPSPAQLQKLFELQLLTGADYIEMPRAYYETLAPVASSEKLILRLASPGEAVFFPEIRRFICRIPEEGQDARVTTEIQINDRREIPLLRRYTALSNVRLTGLDDLILHDYESTFSEIRKTLSGTVTFCPEDSASCATALAVEWLLGGGEAAALSFGGLGGKAALEEVMLALRLHMRYRCNATYEVFPRLQSLLEEIRSERFDKRKPIIGRGIFDVESGIHVDGILKKPEMYEPYQPSLVGARRAIIIGKHSGKKAVIAKLLERQLLPEAYDIDKILRAVRQKSLEKAAGLTDAAFFDLAEQFRK